MDKRAIYLEKKNWAIIGASPNKFKFGYKIYKKLEKMGYRIYPVNPYYDEIEGHKVYKDLESIDGPIDIVSMVVPPALTMDYMESIKTLGLKAIWFQPDTYNGEVLDFCEKNKIDYINDDCLLRYLLEKEL